MAFVATSVLAVTGACFATPAHAAQEPVAASPAQQQITTVWVNGKGQSGFAKKLNERHAEMAAQGWKFAGLAVYTENGDMEGAFVTYVR